MATTTTGLVWGGPDGQYHDPYASTTAELPATDDETASQPITTTEVVQPTIFLSPYTTTSVTETRYITVPSPASMKIDSSSSITTIPESTVTAPPSTSIKVISTVAGVVIERVIITITLETPSTSATLSKTSQPALTAEETAGSGWNGWNKGQQAVAILSAILGVSFIALLVFTLCRRCRTSKTPPSDNDEEAAAAAGHKGRPRIKPFAITGGVRIFSGHNKRQRDPNKKELDALIEQPDDEREWDDGNEAAQLTTRPLPLPPRFKARTRKQWIAAGSGVEQPKRSSYTMHGALQDAGLRKRSGDHGQEANKQDVPEDTIRKVSNSTGSSDEQPSLHPEARGPHRDERDRSRLNVDNLHPLGHRGSAISDTGSVSGVAKL